jgi:hypothetical protein
MKMETFIGLYGNGNEIISWRSLCVRSYLVLSGKCRCMHCCRRSTLHQICTYWIDNDNVCHGSKIVSGDDNIHLSLCDGEKLKTSLYVSSTF